MGFEILATLRLERRRCKPKDVGAKCIGRAEGWAACMLLVLLGPVGHLGPLDTHPVSLGKGSQIFGAHMRIRPRQSGLCKVAEQGKQGRRPQESSGRRTLWRPSASKK